MIKIACFSQKPQSEDGIPGARDRCDHQDCISEKSFPQIVLWPAPVYIVNN